MKAFNQKFEILESLDALDQVQTEKVLLYIKGLLNNTAAKVYQKTKTEAMREIRQALSSKQV